MSILIKNGTVINSNESFLSDIFIEKDKITTISRNLNYPADKLIDAKNKYVIPGGIDVHTHLDMPYGNITSSDDFESGTIAAAFGGTTSIIDFATQFSGQSLNEAFDIWLKKAEGKAVIDYGFHLIVTDLNDNILKEMDEIIEKGVPSFKLFMAYPDKLMLSDQDILKIMHHAKDNGALIMMHAEDGPIIDIMTKKAVNEGKKDPIYHALTRPPILEGEATHRTIVLAKIAEVPCYIVHVSCEDAINVIAAARLNKLPVFAETCPHYLVLNEDYLKEQNFEGAKYVLSPPLRKIHHQKSLWDGLLEDNIQIISTDHCPFNFKNEKELGRDDFTKIPNGGPGIENRLQIIFETGVNNGKISLEKWVEIVSTNPAKLFGMYPQKGTIEVGSDADIVIWDPEAEHIISAETHHMNVDYNMYEGFVVKGNAHTVISRGEVVIEKNKFIGKPGQGKFLKREKFKNFFQ